MSKPRFKATGPTSERNNPFKKPDKIKSKGPSEKLGDTSRKLFRTHAKMPRK